MSDDQPNGSGNRRAAGIGSWGTVQWDDGAVSTECPEFALEGHADDAIHDVNWEVEAAVEALEVFASRWTIEILATLYIAGERRFNELRRLLIGISSRTLSDKLTVLREAGLINRMVVEGPPVRVTYCLTAHGSRAGRLLSPLVAYMKIHHGSVTGKDS